MRPLSSSHFRAFLASVTSLIALTATSASANPLDTVSGLWLNDSKTGHIEILDCGDGTPCGHLRWVQTDQSGEPKDINNSDAALRSRPLIGVKMLSGFKLKKDRWKKGTIYNPKDGKTYGSSLKRLDPTTLQVKGCVGPICKKQIWTLVP